MNRIKKSLTVIVWKPGPGSLEKKILLLRLIPSRGAFWQSPTGHVEHGEGFTEAALREAEEETQLRFERVPQYLGLEYEFDGRWGAVRERAFFLPIQGGESPPAPILDPSEHDAFQWVSPEEAIALVPHQGNKDAIERAANEAPPVLLSKQGIFFQEGEEITHKRTAELLHRSLVREGENYKIRIGNEELEVLVEDTPRFVQSFDRETGLLHFAHGDSHPLDPATLEIRKNNAWICQSPEGWPALFLSPAYYEITKDVRPGLTEGEYILHFLGRDYPLRISQKSKGIDR